MAVDLIRVEIGGGKIKDLQAPHYIKGADASYWMHPEASFKGKAKNISKRWHPIYFAGDPNPFNRGREIYQQNYCKKCKKWYDQDLCPDHHSLNDNDEIVYSDGSVQE